MGNRKIDDFFRQRLQEGEHPFNEDHWSQLEQRLQTPVKAMERSSNLIWRRLAIAVVLAIFCALGIKLYYSIDDTDHLNKEKNDVVLTPLHPNQIQERSASSLDKETPLENQSLELNDPNKKATWDAYQAEGLPVAISAESGHAENVQRNQDSYLRLDFLASQSRSGVDLKKGIMANKGPLISPINLSSSILPRIQDEHTSAEKISLRGPSFDQGSSLSILAGPDLTNVKGAGLNSLSTNLGVLYTKPLFGRISMSMGLIYSKKNYVSPYSFYRPKTPLPKGYYPTDVDATCDILSVPIALNVNVINSGKNSVGLSIGTSSLFMLKEKYIISYSDMQDREYEIKNENQHYFGTVDVSVTFQKKISNQFKIGVKPFVQIPLKGIGYGQTSLQSKGIALTFDYGLK